MNCGSLANRRDLCPVISVNFELIAIDHQPGVELSEGGGGAIGIECGDVIVRLFQRRITIGANHRETATCGVWLILDGSKINEIELAIAQDQIAGFNVAMQHGWT